MHIGFYNPYYDGLGGGERYTLTLASAWSGVHTVELFWDDPSILAQSEKRFGLDLSRVRVVPNIFGTNNFFTKMVTSRQYDLIFFLTDGSVPTSLAKHNILHFQVPFAHISTNAFTLSRFDYVVCNSEYTKNHIDPRFRKIAQVIYPPVAQVITGVQKKEKMILSVGRFTHVHTAKKQEAMIDAFIGAETRLTGWRLVLAGGLLPADAEYFATLQKKIHGHRIIMASNSTHAVLQSLYQKASIYWHAAGFGESNPQHMEHFGISTVEAMSAGAVPIVYKGGGQREIVTHGKNGLLWVTPEALIDETLQLTADTQMYSSLQKSAKNTWERFSEREFIASYGRLISRLQKTSI